MLSVIEENGGCESISSYCEETSLLLHPKRSNIKKEEKNNFIS
jgi:hypothetical protein